MMIYSVEDPNHADSWAAYAPAIDTSISYGKAVTRDLTESTQPFIFPLTCDSIGDPEVCKILYPSANLPEPSNAL